MWWCDLLWPRCATIRAVTYRDEKGALRAKVGDLEGQLAAAQRKIAELSGATPAASDEGEQLGPTSGLGLPSSIRLEKVLEGTLSPAGYEAIAGLIERRIGLKSSQVGTRLETLALPRVGGRVEITVKDGRTHLVLERDWSDRPAGTWVVAGMAAVFGGLAAAAVMHDVMHLSDPMSFAQFLWAGPLIAGLTAPLVRGRARRHIEEDLALRRGTFAALVELAQQHVLEAPRVRVEVATEPDVEDDAQQSAQRSESA